MADFIFNVAKGRIAELHDRVDGNDPANSALIVVLLKSAGLESDAVLKDYDTLDAILTAANDECDFTNYARKTLTDANIGASTVDSVNDRREADIPDQTWTAAGGSTNNTVGKVLICYDSDTTSGTDANIIPLVALDFNVTTNGGDVTLQINASGYFRAS